MSIEGGADGVDVAGVEVRGPLEERFDEVLTAPALELLATLHRELDGRRRELLQARQARQAELDAGGTLDFPPATRAVREGHWRVAPPPPDLRDRRVEITGPTGPQARHQRPQLGREAASWPTSRTRTPPPGQHGRTARSTWRDAVEPARSRYERRTGKRLRAGRGNGDAAGAPVRAAGTCPRSTCGGRRDGVRAPSWTSASTSSTTRSRCSKRGSGAVLLPAQAGASTSRRGCGTTSSCIAQDALGASRGHDQGHRADRDPPGGVRDGRDPATSCATTPTGLNAGRWDYIFSMPSSASATGPNSCCPDRTDGEDDGPVHARLHGAARAAPATSRGAFAMGGMAAFRSRARSKDEEANDRRRSPSVQARTRSARRRRRLRRHLGRPPRRGLRWRSKAAFDERPRRQAPTRSTRQRPDVSVTPEQLLDA